MTELVVADNRSYDPTRFYRNRVRVFLDGDTEHWVWIDEDILFDFLDDRQKKKYLLDRTAKGRKYRVSAKVAKEIVRLGYSSKVKPQIRTPLAKKAVKAKAPPPVVLEDPAAVIPGVLLP